MVVALVTTHLPCFAINGDTHVLPLIGEGAKKFQDVTSDFIDTVPIKLPSKVYRFDLTEVERAFASNVLKDQIGLWTSPMRMKVKDLAWFLPISGVITALLITDDDFSKVLTNNHKVSTVQRDISDGFSWLSGYATSFGLPGAFILTGAITKNDKLRETGVLQYHTLANAFAVSLILQRIFGRSAPFKSNRGEFFVGKNSFPSGHATSAFSLATVLAHQYWDSKYKWVPITSYTLAALAATGRVTAGNHFPADLFVGALLGVLIGRYVVKRYSKHADIAERYRTGRLN